MVAALAFTAGCKSDMVHFTDSIDIVFDFSPVPPNPFDRPDYLHLPYVEGAEFTVTAHRDHDAMKLWDSHAVSKDPDVLRIIGPVLATEEFVTFRCRAQGPGVTDIVVYRTAEEITEWGRAEVAVASPDSLKLFFAGPVLAGWAFDDSEAVGKANVLIGGTGTFLARYFKGDVQLHGNGVLDAGVVQGDVIASIEDTYLFEDRDWLQVTPKDGGTHEIDLSVAGQSIGSLLVNGFSEEDVEFIAIDAESEKYADNGDTLAVIAIGYTEDGEPVYGIEYSWHADGYPEPGEGDMFMYQFQGDAELELEATWDGHTDVVYIHSIGGFVTSSNALGCTARGESPTGAALLVVLAGALCVPLVLRRYPSSVTVSRRP